MIFSSLEAGLKINYIKTLTKTYLKVKGVNRYIQIAGLGLREPQESGAYWRGVTSPTGWGSKTPPKGHL